MLKLPAEIVVHVENSDHTPVARILVFLDIFLEGRFYYGTVVGLTGSDGIVRKRTEEIARAFETDRSLFPMDYKVSLENCDPAMSVGVVGGKDFRSARDAGRESGMVAATVAKLWDDAANEHYGSDRVTLMGTTGEGSAGVKIRLCHGGEPE